MSKHFVENNVANTLEIFVDVKSDSTIIVEHFPDHSLYSIQGDDVIEEHLGSKRDFESMIAANKWRKYDL